MKFIKLKTYVAYVLSRESKSSLYVKFLYGFRVYLWTDVGIIAIYSSPYFFPYIICLCLQFWKCKQNIKKEN